MENMMLVKVTNVSCLVHHCKQEYSITVNALVVPDIKPVFICM